MEKNLWMPNDPDTRVRNVVIRPARKASVTLPSSVNGCDVCVNVVHSLHHLVYQANMRWSILEVSTPAIFVKHMENKADRFDARMGRVEWGVVDVVVAT